MKIKQLLMKLLGSIPTLVIISMVVFGLQKIIPGDPALILAGEDRTPEILEQIREQYHLNEPIFVQYSLWIKNIFQGSLGDSLLTRVPVVDMISSKAPVTIQLSLMAIFIALAIGIPCGILAAVKKGTKWDVLANSFALLGLSIPNFWLGFMMILIISVKLQWLPASGYVPFFEDPVANLKAMIMPSFVLGTSLAAVIFRHARSSMLEVLGADFIRTAKAKGLRKKRVILVHALKNALVPVVTMVSLQFGQLLGGAVLTEQIFSIPGIGKMVVDAVFTRDFIVVQGTVLFTALCLILMNIFADVAYYYLNPKLKN